MQHGRQYLSNVGNDANAFLEIGVALSHLERDQEALEAFRSGLRDDPDSFSNLLELGLLLPEEKKMEIGDWFGKMSKPRDQFQLLLKAFQAEKDTRACEALEGAYRAKFSDKTAKSTSPR